MGHVNERFLRETARYYGIPLYGTLDPCVHCSLANIRHSPIPKKQQSIRHFKPMEKFYIDVSKFAHPSIAGSKYWLLIVDDATDFTWSFFLKDKSESTIQMLSFLKHQFHKGFSPKIIRLDNSGENQKLKQLTTIKGLPLTYEFTAPGTPQQNGRVERKFSVLYSYMRSMLQNAQLPQDIRQKLWAEAAQHATDLINSICTSTNKQPPYFQLFQENPPYHNHLHTFGELCAILDTHRPIKAKDKNRGLIALYIGRARDHSLGTHRFYNINTKRISLNRNVRFLQIFYPQYFTPTNNNPFHPLSQDDEDNDDDDDNLSSSSGGDSPTFQSTSYEITLHPTPTTTTPLTLDDDHYPNTAEEENADDDDYIRGHNDIDYNASFDLDEIPDLDETSPTENQLQLQKPQLQKLTNEMKRLDGFFNPIATSAYKHYKEMNQSTTTEPTLQSTSENEIIDQGSQHDDVSTTTINDNMMEKALSIKLLDQNPFNVPMENLKEIMPAPNNYEEAYYHPNVWCRERWRNAITLELNKMDALKVWHPVKLISIPNHRKPIKCKWVFDIKRNGVFRARLVACGYSQIPGIDFEEFYAPVVNDSVFRIVLIMQIIFKLESKILDVETAFLHGELQEEIFMQSPKGTNIRKDECVKLDKALYGLVQAARQFYKKFSETLIKLQFKVSYADPCLFLRVNQKGMVIIIIHVDDCYTVGHAGAIQSVIKEIESNGLKLKVSDDATDYLSCNILLNQQRSAAWIGQTSLMTKFISKFKNKFNNSYQYKTPGTPGNVIQRPSNDSSNSMPIITSEEQTEYRSGVGTLIQFANKTRPDLSNPVRELAKCMDGATPAAQKEMYRIMKFLSDTKDQGLKISPTVVSNNQQPWTLSIYSDSDWASDKNTRRSVTGFTIFLQDAPILWKSQSQKTVALSSSEAEYHALSETVKEVKFITQVIESLGQSVSKPIMIYVDNVGAIFVAENHSATKHTRHIDARYHFVREYIADGQIQIVFVKSENNKSDIFTKNVQGEIYDKHIRNFLIHRNLIQPKNSLQIYSHEGVLEHGSEDLVSNDRRSEGTKSKTTDHHNLTEGIPTDVNQKLGNTVQLGKGLKSPMQQCKVLPGRIRSPRNDNVNGMLSHPRSN
jgi:hypothetical protein